MEISLVPIITYCSASQPVCRGTQVCRESGRSVPRPNVGN